MIHERFLQVPNGMGGYTQDWELVQGIQGFIDQLSSSKDTDGIVKEDSTHILLTFDDYGFKIGDRILAFNNEYHVNWHDNPLNMSHHWETELKLVGERDA